MKTIASLLIATSLLVGCGGESNNNKRITEGSYAVQMVASDYGSAQIAIGNIIGDRTAQQELLVTNKSDYTISTYQNYLYHIGRFNIDTIDKYDTTQGVDFAEWSYGTNHNDAGSSNTYKLIQQNETNGYLIRYGSSSLLQVDPTATTEEDFVKAEIDLSAYNVEGASVPNMNDAVILNNHLYVAMQRLDANWNPSQAYIAVIDIDTNKELDTNPQQSGLKGIPLNYTNTSTIVEHNGSIYAAGRGDYDSDTGGLEKINTTTYNVTTLIGDSSFPTLNTTSDEGDIYYHVRDVAVVSDQLAYATLSLEQGWTSKGTKVVTINPETGDLAILNSVTELEGKKISDINIDANNRLWLGISNADNPGIYVLDTDTNTINGDFIELDMPAGKIEFLTVQ
jgi:hypothetical protein